MNRLLEDFALLAVARLMPRSATLAAWDLAKVCVMPLLEADLAYCTYLLVS